MFEKLHPDVRVPARSTDHSAGYDLRAYLRGRRVRIHREGAEVVVETGGAAGERAEGRGDGQEDRPGLVLLPGDRALVPTGLKARLPEGFEAQVRVRSSVAYRKGLVLPNAPGTIDADYPDEWLVLLQNVSGRPQRVEHEERIAQAVLARYQVLPWEEGVVAASTDRVGGLGSTGR